MYSFLLQYFHYKRRERFTLLKQPKMEIFNNFDKENSPIDEPLRTVHEEWFVEKYSFLTAKLMLTNLSFVHLCLRKDYFPFGQKVKNHLWFSPFRWSSKYRLHHFIFYARKSHNGSNSKPAHPAGAKQHIDNTKSVSVGKITYGSNHKNRC